MSNRKDKATSRLILISSIGLAFSAVHAEPPTLPTWDESISSLPGDYDAITTAELGDARTKATNAMMTKVVVLQARFPDRGLPRAWVGWLQYDMASTGSDLSARYQLYRDSLANLEAAVAMEPDCCGVEAFISLAALNQIRFLAKDQGETVHAYFAKALAVDPTNLVAHASYAGYLMRVGDYENALKHANAALAASPLNFGRTEQDKALRETARDIVEQTNDRMKRTTGTSDAK